MKRMTVQEKKERHEARRINRLTHSAFLFCYQNDLKRGCTPAQVWSAVDLYKADLEPIVKRMIAEDVAPIHIPRKAANEYIKDALS